MFSLDMDALIFSTVADYTRTTLVGLLATSGIISNAISLSFFLRYQRESLADLHLIALNITDLLICLMAPVQLLELNYFAKRAEELDEHGDDMTKIYDSIHRLLISNFYLSLSLLSCFLTTMLSVTRTLALTKPLILIKKKYVNLAHCFNALFLLLGMTVPCITFFLYEQATDQFSRSIYLVAHTMVFITQYTYVLMAVDVVGVSSVIVARVLRKPRPVIPTQQASRSSIENNRKATFVILTLSVIFTICNATWCLFWAICLPMYTTIYETIPIKLQIFGFFLNLFQVVTNSCANPVVYIVWNSRLNTYTKSLLLRIKRFLLRLIMIM